MLYRIFIYSMILLLIASCNEPENVVHHYSTDTLTIHDTISITWIDTLIQIDTINLIERDTIYIPEYFEPPLVEITPISVKVDSIYDGFPPENMIDNIPYKARSEKGTRYAVPNYPRWIVFDFVEVSKINKIGINIFGWNEGYTHNFIVYNFSDTLAIFETNPELYSEHKIDFVGRRLTLKVTGGKNSWTDIGEIKFYGLQPE